MPRRIPDYPDFFYGWNDLASFGSWISVVATILFFFNLYDVYISKQYAKNNIWQGNVWTLTAMEVAVKGKKLNLSNF